MRVESLDRALDLAEVLLLLEELQRSRIDRLEADVDVEAVRIAHELEKLGVVDRLRPNLGAPLGGQIAIDHPAQEILAALLVRREDVVGEERVHVALVDLELLQHALDRVRAEGVSVHARHRAEGARERAAARRRDRDDPAGLPARDELVVGNRVHVEVRDLRTLREMDRLAVRHVREVLDLLEPVPGLDGVDQLLERELTLAADHEVGVLEPFLGQEAHVRAAHDGDAARRADLVGQPVGLRRRGGDGRDRDEIGREHLVHVRGLDVLDVDPDVVAFGPHEGAEQNRTDARDADPAIDVQMSRLRLYEHKLLERTSHRRRSPQERVVIGDGVCTDRALTLHRGRVEVKQRVTLHVGRETRPGP